MNRGKKDKNTQGRGIESEEPKNKKLSIRNIFKQEKNIRNRERKEETDIKSLKK